MALQKTAHDACSRKVHCVSKKYLDDPFVSFFTKDSTIINSPLMNRGTWLRTTAIEKCVSAFAQQAGGPIQVISFGAGVDTLYFRMRQSRPDVVFSRYVELDFADLVAEKEKAIQRHPSLRSLAGEEYKLLACDLQKPASVADLLKKHINPDAPTILLAEMVFVYIEEPLTSELLRLMLSDVLSPSASVELITYDAMQPNDRFGRTMVESLGSIGVHLKGIHALPTCEEHAARCKKVGFKTVEAMSMKKLYLQVPREKQVELNRLEMIDDWDEWNLVHEHYCFVVAHNTDTAIPPIFV